MDDNGGIPLVAHLHTRQVFTRQNLHRESHKKEKWAITSRSSLSAASDQRVTVEVQDYV